MTSINRRQFLTTTSVALAAGVGCSDTPPPAAVAGQMGQPTGAGAGKDLAKDVATHFLRNVNVGRFGLGSEKATPALWINVYGLAAIIINKAQDAAYVVFPASADHTLKVWSRDPATGSPKDYPVTTSLTISGVKGTSLVTHNNGVEHPADSLSMLLDVKKLGITGGSTTGVESAGIGFRVPYGQLFAGRSYMGSDLTFRTKEFKDTAEAEAYVDVPKSPAYALTDNFNWLVAADGTPTITIDGASISPVIDPQRFVFPICITNDSSASHHQNMKVLQHSRHYGSVMGRATDKDLYLPVFSNGQSGESDWQRTWTRNSGDPICESFVFWNS